MTKDLTVGDSVEAPERVLIDPSECRFDINRKCYVGKGADGDGVEYVRSDLFKASSSVENQDEGEMKKKAFSCSTVDISQDNLVSAARAAYLFLLSRARREPEERAIVADLKTALDEMENLNG